MSFFTMLLFLISFSMRGCGTINKGFFFLFNVNTSFIHEYELEYSKYQIWEMHNGVLSIFCIVSSVVFMLIFLYRIRKESCKKE